VSAPFANTRADGSSHSFTRKLFLHLELFYRELTILPYDQADLSGRNGELDLLLVRARKLLHCICMLLRHLGYRALIVSKGCSDRRLSALLRYISDMRRIHSTRSEKHGDTSTYLCITSTSCSYSSASSCLLVIVLLGERSVPCYPFCR